MSDDEGYWIGRRVAVTGGTGFLGRSILRELVARGAEVVALVRRTSKRERIDSLSIRVETVEFGSQESLERALAGSEVLFHVAGSVEFSRNWDDLRESNVALPRRVVLAARNVGVGRVVLTSSVVTVGGSRDGRVVDETVCWPFGSLGIPYITTKREGEHAALGLSGDSTEVVVVNPGCLLGPEDFDRSEFGRICQRFWSGQVPITTPGGNNFVDVRDVAAGHLAAAVRGRGGERYLLGGWNLTNREFLCALEEASGRRRFRVGVPIAVLGPVLALHEWGSRLQGVAPTLTSSQAAVCRWYLFVDSTKAERELGYTRRPLGATLQDTYSWWMQWKQAA